MRDTALGKLQSSDGRVADLQSTEDEQLCG